MENEKKELTINKKLIFDFFKSLIISIIIFFILNHFGNFLPQQGMWNGNSYDKYYNFYTLFQNDIFIHDVVINSYQSKLPYYFQAVFVDFIQLIICTLIIFLIKVFLNKYKFKLS